MRIMRTAVLGLVFGIAPCASAQEADWIWVTPKSVDQQRAHMLRLFEVAGEVARARLVATCDNHMVVYLNGTEIARSDEWESPVGVDAAPFLVKGRNVVAVACANDGGSAGLAVRLDITYADGTTERVVSSDQWRASEQAPEGWERPGFAFREWGRASVLGSTSNTSMPWGAVMMHREATPASAVRVPEGFKVELVHSSQAGEGSWVSMTFDEQGRVVASPESGGLLRITRTGPGAATVERLDADIGMCQGLLFAYDSLYASVNETPDRQGGLHRLWDADGDGQFERHEVLADYPAKGEHGPHGLVLGPDGLIYTVHGNHTPLVSKVDKERSPFRNWGEDLVLPRLWDPRGHAVGIMTPGGTVLRTDETGEHWQVIAGGLRNSYDIAFAPNGELFTYDSDMEWDIGLPWYRPPRIVHIVEGGEYGWRSGSAKFPDWYPDTLPPVCDTDLSSPVGVAFSNGKMFPEPWASCFFAGDWAYGRILAVHLTPNGASYAGEYEAFVLGLPLSVTDMAFAPDGAMWFTTGGRGTQSGLYRVSYEGEEPAGRGAVIRDLTPGMELRRELEKLAPDGSGATPETAWTHLGASDRFVRFAARLAVERAGAQASGAHLASGDADLANMEALLWLARAEGKVESGTVLRLASSELMLEHLPTELRPTLLRAVELALSRGGEPDEEVRRAMLDQFDGDSPNADPRLARIAAEVLVSLRAPGIGSRLLASIESSTLREDQIRAALYLRLVADQLTDDERTRYFTWLHGARTMSGGMSFEGYIRAMEREAMERLGETEQARLTALLAGLDARAGDKPTQPARPIVQHWDLAAAVGAVESMGGERSLDRGKRLFTAARCIECHRFGGSGGSTGPDLTGVARRFSTHDLLEAAVDPSKAVSDQYEASVVKLRDGRVLNGRLLQIAGGRMDVLTDPFSLAVTSINPGDIESVEPSPISPMPAGLLDTLSASELADLVAYIESGAKR
ncbi:MAG: c-type cytochrome [Phycisphaerales bacterium]|nr:c-type cytochrome [Phycisphaerales bacterium]